MANALLDEIRGHVAELEAQCAQLAPAVDNHDWPALNALVSSMGRVRHALANAWEAGAAERTVEFDKEISERVSRVVEYRAWYLDRVGEYKDAVGERLQLISKWKAYARSVAGKGRRAAALFNDVR